jgi:hypothetical protein
MIPRAFTVFAALSLAVLCLVTVCWVISLYRSPFAQISRVTWPSPTTYRGVSIRVVCSHGTLIIARVTIDLDNSSPGSGDEFRTGNLSGTFFDHGFMSTGSGLTNFQWSTLGFGYETTGPTPIRNMVHQEADLRMPVALPWLLSAILPVAWFQQRRRRLSRGFEVQTQPQHQHGSSA